MSNQNKKFMRKSYLLGGALLAAALFVTTSCKEVMGSLDNPVSSYLEMNKKDVSLWVGQKDSYPATSISPEKIEFNSSDPNVVTVDDQGNIEAVGAGTATITAFVKGNDEYKEGNVSYNVEVKEFDLVEQYAEALEAADGDVTIEIPVDVKAIQTGKLKTKAGRKLTVKSADAKNPSTITLKDMVDGNNKAVPAFQINASFVLKDVYIDATETIAGVDLVRLGTDPETTKTNQDVYLTGDVKDAVEAANKTALDATLYIMDEITIENCWIKNLKSAVIFDGSVDWAIEKIDIKNNLIQLDVANAHFVRVPAAREANIVNNTVYNINTGAGNSCYFFRFENGNTAKRAYGHNIVNSIPLKYTISNNTLVRTMAGKDFANNVPNYSTVSVTAENNILYDVYRFNKFFQSNQNKTYDNNFIFWKDVEEQNDDETYATKLLSAPFENPTTQLDFTQENGGWNLKPTGAAAGAGASRWNE